MKIANNSIDGGVICDRVINMESSRLKEVILDQRAWPFPKDYVAQTAYDLVTPFLQTPDILVMTGLRRSGKSTLLQAIRKKTKESDYYLNFEDDRLVDFELKDFQILLEVFIELFGPQSTFYFDEIQNISGWERVVRRLYNEGKKIFLTGSNADLFSRELGTRLTGRYIPTEVYPLSFFEIVRYQNPHLLDASFYTTEEKGTLLQLFAQYQETGGVPEFVKYRHPKYLHTLYESILYRDIIARYNLSNERSIKELVYLLAGSVGKPVTFDSLKKMIEVKSGTTVSDYCSYLQNSYLCFFVNCYSVSLKRQMILPKKVYFIDHVLAKLVGFRHTEDRGRLLENQVFIELKRRGLDVYYHKEAEECDFIIREGIHIIQAIQVCEEMSHPETKEREINGLLDALKTYQLKEGWILTANRSEEIEIENIQIHILPVWKWMLQYWK